MGIFNFFRKRKEAVEQERLQKADEARAAYQARKKSIMDFLDRDYKRRDEIRRNDFLTEKGRCDEANGTCPKCRSNNVIHVIKRAKGEIHGEGSWSGCHSSFFFSSSSHTSGHMSLDGSSDTYPVNKCKDCGNEWNVEETEYPSDIDPFSPYSSFAPTRLCSYTSDYVNLTWDPRDVKEECGSLEEKKEAFLTKSRSCFWLKDYKTVPREALEYAAYRYMKYMGCDDEVMKVFRPKDGNDEYSYTFPDDVWETVKLVIGWTGPETE